MNILFLTMNTFTGIDMHNIYSDLMCEYIRNGHRPYIVTPREKKTREQTELVEYEDYGILKVQIGNASGVGLVEKGISTVTLSGLYYRAVKKHLGYMQFGLMLYSTPPITLAQPVRKLKKLFRCPTYLMLKDIFPQNAVDLGMFGKGSPLYWYFRRQEKQLYAASDRIGCMSRANVDYVLKHNPWLDPGTVEICPNGILPHPVVDRTENRGYVHSTYNIPEHATVFLYGGNLGKPQGIDHLVKCLEQNMNRPDRFFIICGSGSEYPVLERFLERCRPENVVLENFLPKARYDALAAGCDVGLIFLDSRFTIPNYPSRILSYMENEMPVLVCADANTDVGTDAVAGGYGVNCISDDSAAFTACVDILCRADLDAMGAAARAYLERNFTAEKSYQIIME